MVESAVSVAVGRDALAALHARELPQKDHLCGCFWGAIALRAVGIEEAGGETVDQDRVAAEAGTVLPQGDPSTFVPLGATARRDYTLPLPVASDARAAGTSARALAHALERLAAGRLAVVPVAGPWRGSAVVDIVTTVAALSPETTLLANIRTGCLWGSQPHPSALLDHLAGREADAPPPEWDVGHFVNVAAAVRGPGGALVVVRDSYRSLGWSGYHVQPADAFARALERGDGREGGVLCISAARDAGLLRERLTERGYDLRHWDNGTPDHLEET